MLPPPPPQPPPPPPPPPGAAARGPWLRRIVVGWAVVVAAITLYSVRHFAPTARDQTTIAQALPTVDGVAADLVRAAGTRAVPAITGYVTVDATCRVTSARDGARYQRRVLLYTAPGGEPALLDQLAAKLPDRYRPLVVHPVTGPVLHADPGNFVTVTGGTVAPGEVRVTVDTGCRPRRAPVVEAVPADQAPDRAPVGAVLAELGVRAATWETHRVPCAGGGAVWTVQADGNRAGATGSVADAVRASAPVLSTASAYAYRAGATGFVVHTDGAAVTVTATTTCQ